jgi:transposase
MRDILHIEGLALDESRTRETEAQVIVGVARRSDGLETCPHCGGSILAPNGTRTVRLKDMPIHGKPTVIEWERQRFICLNPDCRKTSSDEHPELHSKRLMTRRMFNHIGERSIGRTFASVAEDLGVDEKTVRNVFHDWSDERMARYDQIKTPRVLGMDEVHLLKKPRGILTNIDERTMIDLLPGRTKEIMAKRIARMPDRHDIEVVAIDMWRPYREIAEALIPDADVVIDKWHVVKYANEGLESIRKSFRADLGAKRRRRLLNDRFLLLKRRHKLKPNEQMILEAWTNEFPALGASYAAKEGFFDIYDAVDEPEARARYMAWQRSLTPEMTKAFQPLITAVGNWHGPIFNYFRHQCRITNAFTEAMNGLVKIANRNGRGYSFDVLRARMMIQYGLALKDEGYPPASVYSINPGEEPPPFVGVHIPTLADLMEDEVNHDGSTE